MLYLTLPFTLNEISSLRIYRKDAQYNNNLTTPLPPVAPPPGLEYGLSKSMHLKCVLQCKQFWSPFIMRNRIAINIFLRLIIDSCPRFGLPLYHYHHHSLPSIKSEEKERERAAANFFLRPDPTRSYLCVKKSKNIPVKISVYGVPSSGEPPENVYKKCWHCK